nr:hypothetical protein K-LCC10_0368 [Kaumoebavirus]
MALCSDVFEIIVSYLGQYHAVKLREVCKDWRRMATGSIREIESCTMHPAITAYPLRQLKLEFFDHAAIPEINSISTLREFIALNYCYESPYTQMIKLKEDMMVTLTKYLPSLDGIPSFINLTQMRNLSVSVLDGIDGAPNLRSLTLTKAADLRRLTNLELLTLHQDSALSDLGGLGKLTSLSLSMVTSDLGNYTTLTSLRELHFFYNSQNIHLVEKFPLRSLSLYTLSGVNLTKLTTLRNLSIYHLNTDLPEGLESMKLDSLQIINENVGNMRYACLPKTLRTLCMPLDFWWRFRKQIDGLPLEDVRIRVKWTPNEFYDKIKKKEIEEMLRKKKSIVWINNVLREKFEFA